MSGTSSANPAKLREYSTTGLDMVDTLRSKAEAVTRALDALAGSRSRHVPDLGDAGSRFTDLVGDWHHLDDFVGDVAQGFSEADSSGGVVTVSDADIARLGRVGFADRDEAIEAAQEAQRELEALLRRNPSELSDEELQRVFDLIERGQYDPAFAVTFSEGLGVDGYVDAMNMLQYHFQDDHAEMPEAGLAMAAVLGTTLNTALDTVYQDEEDYDDPELADLAGEDRLDYGFIEELASGFDPNEYPHQGGPVDPHEVWVRNLANGADAGRNLSVLLSFTNPPDWVAVDIANGRLSTYLDAWAPDVPIGSNNFWGDRSGVVTNYATMLGHNSDASTIWLNQHVDGLEHSNLELVLERHGRFFLDGGEAMAHVVENGLTNDNVHESIPGAPGYVEGGLMRETLMERVIDYVGEHDEINNPHLRGAFAAGVDANMNVIDERINTPFRYDEGERPEGVLDRYMNTHDFLRETMRDADAAVAIHESISEYGMEEVGELPTDSEEREARLRQLGRIQGLVTEAQYNAEVGAEIDELMSRSAIGPTPGSVTNYAISWIPVAGNINDLAASSSGSRARRARRA